MVWVVSVICQILVLPDWMNWAVAGNSLQFSSEKSLLQRSVAILYASGKSMPILLPRTWSFKDGMLLSGFTYTALVLISDSLLPSMVT